MAAELEVHDRVLAKQERLARELELGRQIQTDMLPRGPLKTSFVEVAGVSIPPARWAGTSSITSSWKTGASPCW